MTRSLEILMASDFTSRSELPLAQAVRLAGELETGLVIAHILKKNDPDDENDVETKLRASLPMGVAGSKVVIGRGRAPFELAKIAAARNSRIIVTGVARHNSLGDEILGTMVDYLIRQAPVPVLVVRRDVRDYHNILVATDFSDASLEALLVAGDLFPKAAITLLNSFTVPYESWVRSHEIQADYKKHVQADMDAFVDNPRIPDSLRIRMKPVVAYGDSSIVVSLQTEARNVDLLVVGANGRGALLYAAIGSISAALVERAACDVLIVRRSTNAVSASA